MGQRQPGSLVIARAGDVMLGRLVNETILPVIKESDAFLISGLEDCAPR